jgi:hypothetical protein
MRVSERIPAGQIAGQPATRSPLQTNDLRFGRVCALYVTCHAVEYPCGHALAPAARTESPSEDIHLALDEEPEVLVPRDPISAPARWDGIWHALPHA